MSDFWSEIEDTLSMRPEQLDTIPEPQLEVNKYVNQQSSMVFDNCYIQKLIADSGAKITYNNTVIHNVQYIFHPQTSQWVHNKYPFS